MSQCMDKEYIVGTFISLVAIGVLMASYKIPNGDKLQWCCEAILRLDVSPVPSSLVNTPVVHRWAVDTRDWTFNPIRRD